MTTIYTMTTNNEPEGRTNERNELVERLRGEVELPEDRTNEQDELVEHLKGEVEFLRAELAKRSSPEADDLKSRRDAFSERLFEGNKHLTLINILPLAFVVALTIGVGLSEVISIGLIGFFAGSLVLSLVAMSQLVEEARLRSKAGTQLQNFRERGTPFWLFLGSVILHAVAWIILLLAL